MVTAGPGVLLDDRYRIIDRRAAGATATVWAADDEFLRRRVAIKILHDHLAQDEDFLARFVDEARTAATVSHAALVAVYDSITDQPGIVLEWIDGPDLRQRLDQGQLPPDQAARIGAAIGDGLDALHHHGLIHRDVKPANILLTTDGAPKLTDFGIATANAGDRTATGVVLGTAKYLAPEQVQGQPLDGRADVFALAAVLYEAVTGQAPWMRDGDLPTALARLDTDPTPIRDLNPGIAPSLAGTITKGLARRPDDRWPSARDFADALRGASMLPAPPNRPGPRTPPPPETPAAATTAFTAPETAPDATRQGPTPAAAPADATAGIAVRPRRRRWPRLLGAATMAAIAALGWVLVSATDDDTPTPVDPGEPQAAVIVAATAFDPEGSGPPGEHNDRAAMAIDGAPETTWTTERYRSRDLGAKSGVGLVVQLESRRTIEAITIVTVDAQDWAAEIRVADGVDPATATSIEAFGPARAAGSGLDTTATIAVDATGDTVVVWLTDLGSAATPIRLQIAEITIR